MSVEVTCKKCGAEYDARHGGCPACSYNLSTPEPTPVKNDNPAIWDLVIKDMQERDAVGLERYDTRLQANNGRDALVDAYQELLDAAVYIRQAIFEREGK